MITAEAEKARLAFNSEPSGQAAISSPAARAASSALRNQRGCRAFRRFFEDGRSAIEELARKVQALHALTDLERGITINVGLVSGGQSVNTVAAHAECGVDIRYREASDRRQSCRKCRRSARQRPSAAHHHRCRSGRVLSAKSVKQSAELFSLYRDIAAENGTVVEESIPAAAPTVASLPRSAHP